MSGNMAGGKKAANTNKTKYGKDFYSNIGKIGGSRGTTGGFAYGDNGKKFGKLGGAMSHRSRQININEPLKQGEMDILIKLSYRVLGTLRLNGVIEVDEEQKYKLTLWDLAGQNEWKRIFTDLGIGSAVEIAWVVVIADELHKYKNKFIQEYDTGTEVLSDEELKEFKNLNNLRKAFELVTGRKVK